MASFHLDLKQKKNLRNVIGGYRCVLGEGQPLSSFVLATDEYTPGSRGQRQTHGHKTKSQKYGKNL